MLGVPVSKEAPQGHAEYAKQLIEHLRWRMLNSARTSERHR